MQQRNDEPLVGDDPVDGLPKRRGWRLPVIAAACLIFGALAAYLLKPEGQDIGKYRYTPIASDANNPLWSPDGKSLAYAGKVNGFRQIFIRNLNSAAPVQLTHEDGNVSLVGWTSDRGHLMVATYDPKIYGEERTMVLSSVATFGGELQKVMTSPCDGCSMSADGKTFATLRRVAKGRFGLWLSDPIGTPLREYMPAPFASDAIFGKPRTIFSPDGTKLLLARSGNVDHPEIWLLPLPAGSGPARQIFKGLSFFAIEGLSWFPDNRHIAIALASTPGSDDESWIADTQLENVEPLTIGTHSESDLSVSSVGDSLLFTELTSTADLASVAVSDGKTSFFSTGGHQEHKPAWAARQNRLVWVSDRSGSPEVWLRSADGSVRPVVTAKDFPPGTTMFFMNPALSPEDDRLIYGRSDETGRIQLWISLLNGAPPVRVTDSTRPGAEYASNWSPDGRQYAYIQKVGDRADLVIVRTNGNATPVLLKEGVNQYILPAWSPRGDWILYADSVALGLISSDGTQTIPLGDLQTYSLAFSKDGNKLYGIQEKPGPPALFEVDATTRKVKIIKQLGEEWRPNDNYRPSIRFTLSPDGNSLLYAVSKSEYDIWMLRGYRQPGWMDRLPFFKH